MTNLTFETAIDYVLDQLESLCNKAIANPDQTTKYMGIVRAKLVADYAFAKSLADAIVLNAEFPPVGDEFSDEQINRLAGITAKKLNNMYDQLAGAGFSSPQDIAEHVGRMFRN